MRNALILLFFLLFITPYVSAECREDGLVMLDAIESTDGVDNVQSLHDGVISVEGGDWSSHLTAIFRDSTSSITYDLGERHSLKALYVQADNNDRYRITASQDKRGWYELWVVPRVAEAGLRSRGTFIDGTARYLKITPIDGDRNYSLSEIQVYCSTPTAMPVGVRVREGMPRAHHTLRGLQIFLCLVIALTLVNLTLTRMRPHWVPKDSPWFTIFLCVALVALGYSFFQVLSLFSTNVQLGFLEIAYSKALIAGTAAIVLLLSLFSNNRTVFVTILLSFLACLSIFAYTNFGNLHFRNHYSQEKTFVHLFDMRVYFPNAKYFPELRYDGLYLASLAAFLEEEYPGWRSTANNRREIEERIAHVRVRNLHEYSVTTADTLYEEIKQIPDRFTAERWSEFVRDMHWFLKTMGEGEYLATLADHGGNAAPGWMLLAHLLFNQFDANEHSLSLLGMIDPLLLFALCFVIYRTFGLQTVLVCMIIFGTSDFAKFGATLVGSTLRYDWFCSLGFAVCALKTGRYYIAGALLGIATMIRVFPVVGFLGVALCALYRLGVSVIRKRGFLSAISYSRYLPPLQVALGGLLVFVVIVGASSALFSYPASWGMWLSKISYHATKPNVNHVALRTLVGYEPDLVASRVIRSDHPEPWIEWQETQLQTIEQRKYLLQFGALFGFLLVFLAARRKRLYQSALLGMLLVPFLSYPANYYYHYVALLPLMSPFGRLQSAQKIKWRSILVVVVILFMSSLQYLTLREPWSDICFTQQSVLLISSFIFLLLIEIAVPYVTLRRNKHL